MRGAWLAVVLGLTPAWLYYTTGAHQFGSRFTLDVTIPLLVLLALAFPRRLPIGFRAAVLVGIVVNALGVAWWHWPR